jgi:glyoxylase-like metal-dependent hydrolase (beta-lactamase superfamily II)
MHAAVFAKYQFINYYIIVILNIGINNEVRWMVNVINDNNIRIEKLQLGPFGTNTYIVVCQKTLESAVVDAPAQADKIIAGLEGTKPVYILLTHDHADHTGALSDLRSRLNVPLVAHASDSHTLKTAPEILAKDGDSLPFGNLGIEILHTPGHTPGSICFRIVNCLMAGDTIFPGGPGKTWSPDNLKQILDSITTKILTLPENTPIFSGHGDDTTVKKAKEEYAVFASRPHNPSLCGDVLWLSS